MRAWSKSKFYLIWITLLLAGGYIVVPERVSARTIADEFPRLANVFLTPQLSTAEATQLAKWDIVVTGMEVQYNSPQSLRLMREINPNIIILAYVLSEEYPDQHYQLTDPQHPLVKLRSGIPYEWWLKDTSGNYVSFWPGTKMINVTPATPSVNGQHWYDYLATFMHNEVMSTGLWDGIFYDNVFVDISWLNGGNVDLNRDGRAESAAELDQSWRDGMAELLRLSRSYEGAETIIVGNGGGEYYDHLNGRLIESFPSALDGGWPGAMGKYFQTLANADLPGIVLINGNTTTGRSDDYRQLRYTMTSTLMGDGFISFDYGPVRHADFWWYDEYSTALGQPVGNATNVLNPSRAQFEDSVWRREYENAIVLVNATDQSRRVDLGAGYEKINGLQDPRTNSGDIVSEVTLAPRDGLILLKRQMNVSNGEYINGSLARAFDDEGVSQRQGFFTYSAEFSGGAKIIKQDLENNGSVETVVARGNLVQIFDANGFLKTQFYPYTQKYDKDVQVAVGDIDGNGTMEIVTGTGVGGGPQIRVFDYNGTLRHPGFFAFAKTYRGGVNVAVGDIDGDGRGEIIAGGGPKGGPHVRMFNRFGKVIGGFFAYDPKFRGGVSVTVGDLNGDGKGEIITGPGRGGGPQVRIFDNRGRAQSPGFFAFEQSFRGGIIVSVADVNEDDKLDILVSAQTLY